MVSVFDVEEEKGSSHEHAQYGDGGQDAVEGHIYVAPLWTHDCAILWRFHTYKKRIDK